MPDPARLRKGFQGACTAQAPPGVGAPGDICRHQASYWGSVKKECLADHKTKNGLRVRGLQKQVYAYLVRGVFFWHFA